MNRRGRESGFTLLELIIVLVVVSTLATLAVLSIGDAGRGEKLQRAAERVILAVNLGAEEAALSGHPIGLEIKNNSYHYKIFREGAWQTLERGRLFDSYTFDDDLSIYSDVLPINQGSDQTADQTSDETSDLPTVVLLPDGERWLRSIAFVDMVTDREISLLENAGIYQIEMVR